MKHLDVQKKMSTRGFTLIEMLVSVSIFAIVMVVSVGTLIVLVTSANSAQVLQSISTNLSFALDSMSRNIRTGYDYHCTNNLSDSGQLPATARNCPSDAGADGFVYTDSRTDERVAYRFEENTIQQKVGNGSWKTVTSSEVVVEELLFFVDGAVEGDNFQPTVRILLKARATDEGAVVAPFYLQTTIVQRAINQ